MVTQGVEETLASPICNSLFSSQRKKTILKEFLYFTVVLLFIDYKIFYVTIILLDFCFTFSPKFTGRLSIKNKSVLNQHTGSLNHAKSKKTCKDITLEF